MDDWITLLLAIGVILRATRLVTTDTLTAPIRERLTGGLYTWATCGWCASMWLALPVAVTWWLWGHCGWWHIGALAMTASWLAGVTGHSGEPARVEVMPVGPVTIHKAPEIGSGHELKIDLTGMTPTEIAALIEGRVTEENGDG